MLGRRNFPARRADGPNAIQSRDDSSKRLANTDTGDRVATSCESGEMNPYELSDFSVAPQSRGSGNLQENFLNRDKVCTRSLRQPSPQMFPI